MWTAAVAFLASGLAACASTGSNSAGAPATTGVTPVGWTAPGPCEGPPGSTPVEVAPVAGTPTDEALTSFDGTVIRLHWFPQADSSADHPAPTVLMGPGWGGAGDTNVDSTQGPGIKTLRNAGYNVLTWDPRGFGKSTGRVEVDSADYEGKDVQRIISWVATEPSAQLDGPGDPRVGMVGGSYGGAIQFITAAADCRVDAIVPQIAWNSLVNSLYKAETVKSGWSGLLNAAALGRSLDPHIVSASQSGQTTGALSSDDVAWFASRGTGDLVKQIKVPTLIEQGTVDTLFTLQEGVDNFQLLQQAGVPVAMAWFCGGHGTCLTNGGEPGHVDQTTMTWLNRYLKRDITVDTGPGFTFVDQNGVWHGSPSSPVPSATPLTAQGSGSLTLTADGGSGPAEIPTADLDFLAGVVGPITPGPATNAVNLDVATGISAGLIVGAPQLTLTYQGTSPTGPFPTRIFAQLVDPTSGVVLGNQVTPIAVTLDGQSHTLTLPLEQVAFAPAAGGKVTLQLVAVAAGYAIPRLGGQVTFAQIDVALPTAAT
jgi:ABC-2 type transport system ATP-binding protein